MKVGQMRHLKCGSDSGISESWLIRESAIFLWSFGRQVHDLIPGDGDWERGRERTRLA